MFTVGTCVRRGGDCDIKISIINSVKCTTTTSVRNHQHHINAYNNTTHRHHLFNGTPESGIPPSDRATRRCTNVHLDVCIRFSALIGQIGRVMLFDAGPRRHIGSRPSRLAVTVFWRALTAYWRQKGKRKQVFPRAIHTTKLPSNRSPLTFRNNQIQSL